MMLGSGCLGEKALEGSAIRQVLGQIGLDRVLLVANGDCHPRELTDLPVLAIRVPYSETKHGLDVARRSRSTRLVVDLPVDLGVEDVCGELFALSWHNPGLDIAVLTPTEGPLSDPAQLSLVFDDLASQSVRYWHSTSRAHLADRGTRGWLEALDARLAGISLDDVAGGEIGMPPGTGEVDFAELKEWAGKTVDLALDISPVADVSVVKIALEQLAEAGLK